MKTKIIFILFFLLPFFLLTGQSRADTDSVPGREYLIQNVKRGGEVLPEIEIKEVTVVGRPSKEASGRSEFKKYERLIFNLKKVYPYSLIVRNKLQEVNNRLILIDTEKERKEYLREFEKNVLNEYEDDIRHMTITQGRLLLKLIDRETQNTSYDLIREYRGRISAAFWQGIARIFGTNLKEQYDPYGEDALIEVLVVEIENGTL